MSEYRRNNRYRMSGILLHPTSLPSPYGIGDLGQSAYEFVDFLKKSGQTLWQVLPVGPTGYGDSPYQSCSSFAGQPLLISPDVLVEEGLLTSQDLTEIPRWQEDRVDYGYVQYYKNGLFEKAFTRFSQMDPGCRLLCEYGDFLREHAWWLEEFTLYCAVKNHFEHKSWLEWDDEIRRHEPEAVEEYRRKLEKEIHFYQFQQFMFYRQWFRLKNYANDQGIFLLGDMPMFVALDSCDVWSAQKMFRLDETGTPSLVAGVPPDYFSSTGQLWGNPLYNWDRMQEDGFSWWISRIRHALHLCDYVRIDHYAGFDTCWAVPYGDETAQNGHHETGKCRELFQALFAAFDGEVPLFVEDLGTLSGEAVFVRDEFRLPGMRILQFAFDDPYDSTYLPFHYDHNCLCYTGTHDNDTSVGWYEKASDSAQAKFRAYMGSTLTEPAWDLIRMALSSTARYAMFPLQDVLCLNSEARMNTPGLAQGNWTWRFLQGSLTEQMSSRLLELCRLYGRI